MLCLLALVASCNELRKKEEHSVVYAIKTIAAPTLDGVATESCWKAGEWYPIDQLWSGDSCTPEDFSGRYKLAWDSEALYLLVEIVDDSLFDQHVDPLKLWWDDDSLQIMVDEDNSGGLHQYNNNAFAYHLSLSGDVVDLAADRSPRLYNDHIRSHYRIDGKTVLWEMAIGLHPESRENGNPSTVPLYAGKKIGFALAYNDNDGSKEREHYIGSVFVPPEDRNQGWINANIFATLALKE